MKKTVTIIPADKKTVKKLKKKRVCAYARVSTAHEEQRNSYLNQVKYYSDLIRTKPDWEFAGIYTDEGITGTLTKKRPGFNQMVQDALAGKIDMILTKSISRFARNTVDLLRVIRMLRDNGVEVYFEKENINTISEDGELMITIFASLAQEEVRSLSENVRWARKKKIDAGELPIRMQVTGYKWDGDELIVDEDWAWLIRRIFKEYMDGKSPGQICKGLKADGIKTIRGHWFQEVPIYQILRNPLYKGDLLLQKTFVADPIMKIAKWNKGELPMVYVEENHEPIIEPKFFDAVQKEMQRRKAEWDTRIFDFEGMRGFTHLIRCGHTGEILHHGNGAAGYENDGAWACDRHKECPYKGKCNIIQTPDLALRQACNRALSMKKFDEKRVRAEIDEIIIPRDGAIIIKKKDGTTYEDYFRSKYDTVIKQPPNQNCFSKKLICGCCGHYYSSITGIYSGVRRVTWNCRANGDNSLIHENVLKFRVAEAAGWKEFSFERFKNEVDHIDMDKPCHMIIHFKNGVKKDVEYYANKTTIRREAYGQKDNTDTGD